VTSEPRKTQQEEAAGRLLEENVEELSEPAKMIIGEAHMMAYAMCLCRGYCYQPQEYEEAMTRMRRAATGLTDRDEELLEAHVMANMAASASRNRYDDDTIIGFRGESCADLHYYYGTVWNAIDDVLTFRTNLMARRRTAEQEPDDFSDVPF
jgi:hypothetical protein